MERGPRGLPSFPPADAIGSSSRASSSRSYGGGGRDTGARGNVGMGRSSSYGRGVSDSRGGGPTARQGRSAPSMRGGPSGGGPVSRQGASSAVRPRVSKEEAARIVSRLDEMSRRLEREQREIFAGKPDYLARGKIQDRVISAAAGQPYQMKTPTVYTGAPPRVTPAPTFSVNAMTTDLGRLQRGMRDRISQEAFIQAGYMPGFKSLGDIERGRKISAAVGQPYGMKTPISPARGQPYGVKSPISSARGQPYGMNLPPSNVPSTEISAKTVPVKRDISDISKLTDEYSLASGMSFRGFPTIGAGQVEQRPTLAGTPSVIPRTPEDHMTSVLGTSYAQRLYPGEQMFRTPQEVSRDIAGYSPAGIEALRRSKTYSDRIPSDSSAPVSPSAQVPYTNVTVLQKAREPLRPFSAGASEGLPPGYSDRYLNKQADASGETVLQVEDVPPESAAESPSSVAGYRKAKENVKDIVTKEEVELLPPDLQQVYMNMQRWERKYDTPYPLSEDEKNRLRTIKIITSPLTRNVLAKAFTGIVEGVSKVGKLAPGEVGAAFGQADDAMDTLQDPAGALEQYFALDPIQRARLAAAVGDVNRFPEDSSGQGGIASLGGGSGYGGAGGVSGGGMSGGGGSSVSQSGGRPYIYYQWDVGVNIPSPGDPDYTNYQEYLRQREEARAA